MTSQSSKISVIMPVFNGERYLRQAIDSILHQTYSQFEFVIVDDGSTDSTAQILRSYRDPRMVMKNIEHAGLIPALNVAVATATGDLLARMDADDKSLPDRLRLQHLAMMDQPEIAVLTGRCELIGPNDEPLGMQPDFHCDDMLLELAARNPIVHGSVMMRRTSLPTPVYHTRPEDYVLWLELAKGQSKFACLANTIYQFRTHSDRFSIREGVQQSAAAIELQWSLMEECTRTRNLSELPVRTKLLLGWGILAGACFQTRQHVRGMEAIARFDALLPSSVPQEMEPSIDHAVEAMIWGGCPVDDARRFRRAQLARHPFQLRAWRNLLNTTGPIRILRRLLRRG